MEKKIILNPFSCKQQYTISTRLNPQETHLSL